MTESVRLSASGKPLHSMFTAIPRHYDLINRIITLGLDKKWRYRAARECLKSEPVKMLDLCCGTGDLAVSIARLAKYPVEITGLDYSQPMLDIATRKAAFLTSKRKVSFINGDAGDLPFPTGYFDCVGISFAFRNLIYKNPLAQLHLGETFRVLKTGGKFVIVESSQPKSGLIRKIYHLYLFWFAFRMGFLLSGNRQAYQYLAESAARFYTPEEIADLLIKAGFRRVSFQPLLLGAVSIYIAIK